MCFPQVTFSLTPPCNEASMIFVKGSALTLFKATKIWLWLLFSTVVFLILIKIKGKIYYKLSSNEAQGLCLNHVQIQGQLHKKQWSKQRVWNLFSFPMLHSDHVPFQCKMLGKPSSWWGRGAHPNGWGEIRGNRYSKIKLNEVKVICGRERNPEYRLHSREHPKHPQPSQLPSHTSAIPKTLLWPCLVSIPRGLKFCPDKNVHRHRRVLIKQSHWRFKISGGNKRTASVWR